MIRRRMMIARSLGKKATETSSIETSQHTPPPQVESVVEVTVESVKNEVAEESTTLVVSSAKKKTNLKKDMLSNRAP